MCLATVYDGENRMQPLLENVAVVEFVKKEDGRLAAVMTDVFGRKTEIDRKIKSMDLTEGLILLEQGQM